MLQTKRTCDKCGAQCDFQDSFCKNCGYSFAKDRSPVLNGVSLEKFEQYVGNNADYYAEKFRKAKDKKFFFQWNWASVLFGTNWYAYRKMYGAAIILQIIICLFSSVFSVCVPMIFADETAEYYATMEAYEERINSDEPKYYFDENGYRVDDPEIERMEYDLNFIEKKLKTLNFLFSIPSVLLSLFVSLMGNYFYRSHVTDNIRKGVSTGGTSRVAAVIFVVAWIILNTIVSTLIGLIPEVTMFDGIVS